MEKYCYNFKMGDIGFSVESEMPLTLDDFNEPFVCQTVKPSVKYHVCIFDPTPLGKEIYKGEAYTEYETESGFERSFSSVEGLKLCRKKSNPNELWLYGTDEKIKLLEKQLIRAYFGLEIPFLEHHAFLLHASLVSREGHGVVFSAPSGVGKSTQAALWEDYLSAQVLNGDRALIRNFKEESRAYGSVFSGSSGICRNESVKLEMIVILEQGERNELSKMNKAQAFTRLYSQTLNNPWSSDFVNKLTLELTTVLERIPVYLLSCRPDKEAVELVKNELLSLS